MKPRKPGRQKTLPDLPKLAESFIAYLKPVRAANTCWTYAEGIKRLYAWLYKNDVAIEAVMRLHIMQWCQDLHDQGLAPATRLITLVSARCYFEYLNHIGRLTPHARELIQSQDFPKLPQTLPRALEPDVDRKLQDLFGSSTRPTWLGLLLMRQTGMRIGELAVLPMDCVSEATPGRDYVKVPVGKLNSERMVPIDAKAAVTVEKLRSGGKQGRAWLVPSRSGNPISTRTLHRAWVEAKKRLGLQSSEPLTPHQLRHAYATEMLNAGMSLSVLKEILGHRNVNMTLRYATPTLQLLTDEYDNAIAALQKRYAIDVTTKQTTANDISATAALKDLVRLINRNAADRDQRDRRQARSIIKRLERIGARLTRLKL